MKIRQKKQFLRKKILKENKELVEHRRPLTEEEEIVRYHRKMAMAQSYEKKGGFQKKGKVDTRTMYIYDKPKQKEKTEPPYKESYLPPAYSEPSYGDAIESSSDHKDEEKKKGGLFNMFN